MVKYILPIYCSRLFSYLLMASSLVASEVRLAITDKMLVREKLEKECVHLKMHKDAIRKGAIFHLSFSIGFEYLKLFWNSTNLC